MRSLLSLIALGVTVLVGSSWAARPAQSASAEKPNIVCIVADDLGYAGISCQGCKDIPTPHIDSLAANGVRFTDGYVSCPVCSPTRAGLVTGRYQQRFGHEFNPGALRLDSAEFGLPLSEVTIADILKAAGYKTGMVGKWHLGADQYHPMQRGFEEFFGFLGGAHPYLPGKAGAANAILRGTTPVDEAEYLTDAFTREALAFIDRHAKEPFFLYLTYNAVHGPMQGSEKRLERFAGISDPLRRTHATMLAALDDGVGAVLKKLRQTGIEDNTLIFFISDNGGPTAVNTSSNEPFRGFKGQVLEGGIRVPFIIQWKKVLPAGRLYQQPVTALDILPTAVAAAGAKLPADRPIDGVNLLPYLTGKIDKPPHDALYWRFGIHAAVRQGNWKLVRQGAGPFQLYDLASDPHEDRDLSAQKPEVARQLEALWKQWDAQLAKPRWGSAPGDRPKKAARKRKR
ncbi:MAG: sulfatase [Thermoguttaceae bacterium]